MTALPCPGVTDAIWVEQGEVWQTALAVGMLLEGNQWWNRKGCVPPRGLNHKGTSYIWSSVALPDPVSAVHKSSFHHWQYHNECWRKGFSSFASWASCLYICVKKVEMPQTARERAWLKCKYGTYYASPWLSWENCDYLNTSQITPAVHLTFTLFKVAIYTEIIRQKHKTAENYIDEATPQCTLTKPVKIYKYKLALNEWDLLTVQVYINGLLHTLK